MYFGCDSHANPPHFRRLRCFDHVVLFLKWDINVQKRNIFFIGEIVMRLVGFDVLQKDEKILIL